MWNLDFQPPQVIEARVLTRLPDAFRQKRRSEWADANKPGQELDSFLEGPAFDRDGNLYVTYSGTRGQEVPVSIFRVRPNGTRESFSSGIVNPTSMAIGPEGRLYVSSRFEGTIYRVDAIGVRASLGLGVRFF